MNRWQKIAWFNLIVIGTALVVTGVAVGVVYFWVGMPKALGGLGFLGICGVMGLSPFLFKKKKIQAGVDFDERDRLINYRAVLGAYSVLWIVLTAACMVPFFILGPRGSVPVITLPLMLCGVGITLTLVHSIGTLIQYGRRGKGEKS